MKCYEERGEGEVGVLKGEGVMLLKHFLAWIMMKYYMGYSDYTLYSFKKGKLKRELGLYVPFLSYFFNRN